MKLIDRLRACSLPACFDPAVGDGPETFCFGVGHEGPHLGGLATIDEKVSS
jgi:hypothetical protein